jgi:hypothetical protein
MSMSRRNYFNQTIDIITNDGELLAFKTNADGDLVTIPNHGDTDEAPRVLVAAAIDKGILKMLQEALQRVTGLSDQYIYMYGGGTKLSEYVDLDVERQVRFLRSSNNYVHVVMDYEKLFRDTVEEENRWNEQLFAANSIDILRDLRRAQRADYNRFRK